jgi:hypothetical protein
MRRQRHVDDFDIAREVQPQQPRALSQQFAIANYRDRVG